MPTTADAGPDQEHCNLTGWTMAANTPAIGTGSWAKIAGSNSPTFSSNTSPTATVTNATAQTYVYQWKITNGSCVSSDNVTITLSSIPLTTNAGPDQPHVCGTTATMAAVAPSNGIGNWSQISGPNTATFASVITNNTAVTGLIPGTYVFRWTISSGVCTPVSADVSITVFANPTAANAGVDKSLCGAASTVLAGNNISSGTGLWSVVSGPAGSSFTDATSATATINGLTSGTYLLQWTSTLGTCSLSDQVEINNYATPTTSAAAATVNNCLFSPLNLQGNVASTGVGTWTQTSGSSVIISSPSSPTTSILGAVPGTYTFRWTIANGTCTSSYSDEVVTVTNIPTMALAGFDQTFTCAVTSATLAGNTASVGTGTWTELSGPNTASFTNSHSPTTDITGLVPGTYSFQWQIANGTCTSSDVMKVIITSKTSDLAITKTDGAATYTSGANNVYTIVASNAGPDNSIGAVVTDNAPVGTSISSWSAVFAGGATGSASGTGNLHQTINLPVGGTATYTVTVSVPCTFTGSLTNSANIAHSCDLDPNQANNTATDTDANADGNTYTTNLWNGSVSSDWNTPANWGLNSVPSIADHSIASIPSGTAHNPIINSVGMSTAKLIIQNGANLTINPGKDLHVTACADINGACGLYLKSDGINGNASFLSPDGNTVAYHNGGTACVEVFLNSCDVDTIHHGCWHYISSPVTSIKTGDVFAGDKVQVYDEAQGKWKYITDGNTIMHPEEGFIVNNATDAVRTFHGYLNNGTISSTLNRTVGLGYGWNLVGNPYPSKLDFDSNMDWTDIDKVVYYYDQQAGNYWSYPQGGPGTGTRYAPAMQGFFVHVSNPATVGEIKFDNTNRTATGDVNFYKKDPIDMLRLQVEGSGTMNDKVIVYFRQDANAGYDKNIDCQKFAGIPIAPQLYTLPTDNTSTQLSINALPYTDNETVVPMGFNVVEAGSGQYTLTASNTESFRPGTTIRLEDTKLQVTQDLMQQKVYTFNYTNGDDANRFRLHFTTPTNGIGEVPATSMQLYSVNHEVFLKDLSNKPTTGELHLYNMVGQELAKRSVDAVELNKYSFDVADGYYIVKVVTKNNTFNSKIYIH